MGRELEDAIVGCLLGTAVGDALGLCCEGLSRQRQQRLYPDLSGYHLLGGRGMVSDDTEHTCMVAQALIVSGGEPERFTREFARRLRFWLLGVPAGIGFATLRAILKLWAGAGPARSGVFSAGNGPAMRSALLGVCYGAETERLQTLVRASTRLTHTDPKAEQGALAVALAAFAARTQEAAVPMNYLDTLRRTLDPDASEFIEKVAQAAASAQAGWTTSEFAASMGLSEGIGGYVYHTVPVALHAWFRHPTDFRAAVLEVIRCGGDTDTTGAIVGGIVGTAVGRDGIPADWRRGLWEWPHSVAWMEHLGKRLAEVVAQGKPLSALPQTFGAQPIRNGLFLGVVLAHGFRRLLPPY